MRPVYRGLCLLLYIALICVPATADAQLTASGPVKHKYLVAAFKKGMYDIRFPDSRTTYTEPYSPDWKRDTDTLVWLQIDNKVWDSRTNSVNLFLMCNGRMLQLRFTNLAEHNTFVDFTGIDMCNVTGDYINVDMSANARTAGDPYPYPRLYFRADGFDHVLYHTLNAYDITGELYRALGDNQTAMHYRPGSIIEYYYK